MLKSYLRTALRVFWRYKGFSLLNVAGLSIGLASAFLILLWMRDEVSYDRFHDDDVYRVMRTVYYGNGNTPTWPAIPMPLAQEMRETYPEVDEVALTTWEQSLVFNYRDAAARERGYHVGPAFFEVMSFPLVVGRAADVLQQPGAVVISRTLAEKYFGADWQYRQAAVGEVIRIDNRQDFTVTGVFEDVPSNSSMQFDFVLPIEDFSRRNGWLEEWGNNGLRLIAKLHDGSDPSAFNEKIREVINEHNAGARAEVFLQKYADQRLYSRFVDGKLVGGRIDYLRTFGLVAVFILLIASINFMNLATARSSRRAREIGVRKALGAGRMSLAGQFLGESFVLVSVAFLLAVGLTIAALPAFNAITDKAVTIRDIDLGALGLFGAAGFLTAILSGIYPAVYLSSFNVIKVLRGGVLSTGGAGLRKALVIFQFAMSILLIVGTMTVYKQIRYIQTKHLGVDRSNVVYVPLEGGLAESFDAFRAELEGEAGVASITRASGNPLSVGQSTTSPSWEGKAPDSEILFHIVTGDHDLLEGMRMQLAAGRNFDRRFGADSVNFIVNQRAVAAMGMQDPVGQPLSLWGDDGTIIGVVEDFHMSSLHSEIEPTIIRLRPEETSTLFVRLQEGHLETGIGSFGRAYARFNPTFPFDYRFLDHTFQETYRGEIVVGRLANYFTFLAVLIACLGLFGLASFTTEQRRKEIGIRKALGAGVASLVFLLSKDLVKLVLVAFVLTAPLAYLLMDRWLEQFAYRADFGLVLFAAAGAAAVAIAWATVGAQAARAAAANPINALRMD